MEIIRKTLIITGISIGLMGTIFLIKSSTCHGTCYMFFNLKQVVLATILIMFPNSLIYSILTRNTLSSKKERKK